MALSRDYTTLTGFGMSWCRVIAAIILAMALFHLDSLFRMERGNRFFHKIVILVHFIAAGTYALMSLGDGFEPVRGVLAGPWDQELIYWREFPSIRYVELLVTTPLVLVLLLRTAAVPAVHIFGVIVKTSNILIVPMGAGINRSDIRWQLYYIAAVARLAMGTGTISLGCYYAMKINHPWLTSTLCLISVFRWSEKACIIVVLYMTTSLAT